jgi:hypothetical protein
MSGPISARITSAARNPTPVIESRIEVHGAEAHGVAVGVCDEHVGAVRGRDLVQYADGIRLVPL